MLLLAGLFECSAMEGAVQYIHCTVLLYLNLQHARDQYDGISFRKSQIDHPGNSS